MHQLDRYFQFAPLGRLYRRRGAFPTCERLESRACPATGSSLATIGSGAGYSLEVNTYNRVAVMVLDPSDYATWANGSETTADIETMTQRIYASLPDEFDFIVFENNQASAPSGTAFDGDYTSVQNGTTGIDESIFNSTASYGSAGNLQGVIHLTENSGLIGGPSLHEFFHRWGNYLPEVNGGYPTHWGFSSVGGQLGGFQYGTLQNLGGGLYQAAGPGGHTSFGPIANYGNSIPYAQLELYEMGLIGSQEVTNPIQIAENAQFTDNTDTTFQASSINTISIQDIVSAEGTRTPTPATSQKNFRALFVVLTSAPLDQGSLDQYDSDVSAFSETSDEGDGLYNFWMATGGRATMQMDAIMAGPADGDLPPGQPAQPGAPLSGSNLVTVVSVQIMTVEFGKAKHLKKETEIAMQYSGPIASQTKASYVLLAPGKDQKYGTKDDLKIAILSADYNPATYSVDIVPKGKKLTFHPSLELQILGSRVTDTEGREIDAGGDGQAGSNGVFTLSKASGSIRNSAERFSSRLPGRSSDFLIAADHARSSPLSSVFDRSVLGDGLNAVRVRNNHAMMRRARVFLPDRQMSVAYN